ncbi:hypothetical protein AMATHDRAFT_48086 [Amanita thiersii Skay4041]|uniref:Integrase zinc-binding domain-containing protein n=1 Tax=Amanita thiersii Skay4041 TaxID=703135 RepID=A0A2A9NPJ6_9AGAR|nr:hypothetical protein AMATHDRAFT_48086 [Amanita thiersii Skay4041]
MSPDRLQAARSPQLCSKPYDRIGVPMPTSVLEEAPTDQVLTDTEDRPGFPTYAEYKTMEQTYINSLSPKRQPKALISQVLFDKIWDVLTNSSGARETAQFRFWVRKMFMLQRLERTKLSLNAGVNPGQLVVVHDGLLVAVQEQIYGLLCYCHGQANHGGRDRTCAVVRRHYTWVPKELIAQFVKMCPTCRDKKQNNGHVIQNLTVGLIAAASPDVRYYPPSPSLCGTPTLSLPFETEAGSTSSDESCYSSSAAGSSLSPLQLDVTLHSLLSYKDLSSTFVPGRPNVAAEDSAPIYTGVHPKNVPTGLGLHSLPMSREVSLYQGLPNGWQFHSDYAAAYTACVEMNTQRCEQANNTNQPLLKKGRRRPRVPSIAPILGPDLHTFIGDGPMSICTSPGLTESGVDAQAGARMLEPLSAANLVSSTMFTRDMQAAPPQEMYSTCIDPALLSMPSIKREPTEYPRGYLKQMSVFNQSINIPRTALQGSSVVEMQFIDAPTRAGLPPPLNLLYSNTMNAENWLTIQSLYAYRDSQPIPSPTLSDSGSPDSLTPELLESDICEVNNDSPLTTALSTPHDESLGGLAEMMANSDGSFRCSPIEDSNVRSVGGGGISFQVHV